MKPDLRHTMAFSLLVLFILVSGGLTANCLGTFKARQPAVVVEPLTAIRCGKLLDVETGRLSSRVVVLVRGERITAVGTNLPIRKGARIVDLSGSTVLPGLIDAHTHITYHFDASGKFGSSSLELPSETLRYASQNARDTLLAGYTTIRNLGASGGIDLQLRDQINRGDAVGPRMLVSGAPLTPDDVLPYAERGDDAGKAARLAAIRQFVHDRIEQGVDVIKIFEGVDSAGQPLFSEDDIRAAVEEAARSGRRVAVHAHEASAIKAAVRGGCTSIEHGSFLDAEAIHLMVEHHTPLVPTLFLPTHYLEHKSQFDFDEGTWQFFHQLQAHNLNNARAARIAGIRIIAGSDAVAGLHGHNARELEWLVKSGMTPAEAIRAATVDAAALLGVSDRVGTLKPGQFADIIAIAGDPLHDITRLQTVGFVMKGGRVVKDSLSGKAAGT